MTAMGVRSIALWAGIVLMTACGGPLPEEGVSGEASPDVVSEEAMLADENVSMASEEGEQLAWCPLEVLEPCSPNLRTCSVRCCDESIVQRKNTACGDCQPWANIACGAAGPKRIRWIE